MNDRNAAQAADLSAKLRPDEGPEICEICTSLIWTRCCSA